MKVRFIALFTLFLIAGTLQSYAQDGHRNFAVTTQKDPEFPGGNKALYTFFYNEMEYPEEAKANKIEGDVYVSFFVETDSTVSEVTTLGDLGYGTKEEAIRLIKLCKFAPGVQSGRAVRMNMMVPVLFRLYE